MSLIKHSGISYAGKVALITGGSMGIGEACARVFVNAGAKVVICARGVEAGRALAKELNLKGPGACHFEVCDVSKPEDVRQIVDRTVELHGRLDCLLNNAGYHDPYKPIADFTLEEAQQNMQTNFFSYFVACKQALPHLRKTKGNIINMGSLVGIVGQEGASVYCATKGAISGFTKALAIEEGPHGVRVNAVLPGNIMTGKAVTFLAAYGDGGALTRYIDSLQVTGHCGVVEDVAQACLFLASDAAGFITGIELLVTGGAELGYGVKFPMKFIK